MLNLRSFFLVLILGCIIGVIFFAPPVKRKPYNQSKYNTAENSNINKNELLVSDSYNELPSDDSKLIELEEKILASLKSEQVLPDKADTSATEIINEQVLVDATKIDRFVNTGWPSISRTVIYYDKQGANAEEHTINFIPKFPNTIVGWREFDFTDSKNELNTKLSLKNKINLSYDNLKNNNLKLKEKLLVAKLLNSVGASKIEKIEPSSDELTLKTKQNDIEDQALNNAKSSSNQDLVYMSIIEDRELLRVGPGFQYTAITIANSGDTFVLEEIRNNWCRVVTSEGLRAWAPKNSLKLLDIEAEG